MKPSGGCQVDQCTVCLDFPGYHNGALFSTMPPLLASLDSILADEQNSQLRSLLLGPGQCSACVCIVIGRSAGYSTLRDNGPSDIARNNITKPSLMDQSARVK